MSERHRAKRALGQHFLVDPNLQRKIVEATGAHDGDSVMEIGPGQGALTSHLVDRGVSLCAVELDNDLAAALERHYDGFEYVSIVHGDFLKVSPSDLVDDWSMTRVVGNIPYNITTLILFHLLESPRPLDIVLMVQAEVGDRIVAAPGSKAYGALAVGVQTVAKASRLFKVPRKAFRPVPKVESVVIRITPIVPEPLSPSLGATVRRLTRATFQWRRKQLQSTLRKHADLRCSPEEVDRLVSAAGVDPTIRPESLSPDQFVAMARVLEGTQDS